MMDLPKVSDLNVVLLPFMEPEACWAVCRVQSTMLSATHFMEYGFGEVVPTDARTLLQEVIVAKIVRRRLDLGEEAWGLFPQRGVF